MKRISDPELNFGLRDGTLLEPVGHVRTERLEPGPNLRRDGHLEQPDLEGPELGSGTPP